MHFDALTLACVIDEIQSTLIPGRIQQVILPDGESIGLEVYAQGQRHNLLISAAAPAPRLYCVADKLRRGVERETPLLMLLRKYVRDGWLSAVVQPDPVERVVRLAFEHKQHGQVTLVAELFGRNGAIILLNPADKILGVLHPSSEPDAHGRILAPGHPYAPPFLRIKVPPSDDGSSDYYERLAAAIAVNGPLWKALANGVAGVSPSLGREVAWRCMGDSDAPAVSVNLLAVAQALQELWAPLHNHNWTPGVWREQAEPVGFSAYAAHWRGNFAPSPSMSAALDDYYRTTHEPAIGPADGYAVQRQRVRRLLLRARQRIQRQIEAMAGDEPEQGAAERMRTQAQWLLALHHQVTPAMSELTVDLDGETLHIALTPNMTPVAQAERMFKSAARMERAAIFIPQRRARLLNDLEFLAQLEVDLGLAQNQPEIAVVEAELLRGAFLPTSRQRKQTAAIRPGRPHTFRLPDGTKVLVGRNARQNEAVTFDLAHADDLWLHVRGAPGAHVVVRCGGRTPLAATMAAAAQLAGFYSSVRGERAVDVIVTRRRFVQRAVNGRPGQVTVQREEVIRAPAMMPEGVLIEDGE